MSLFAYGVFKTVADILQLTWFGILNPLNWVPDLFFLFGGN